jgi:hypothetical protein
MRCLYNANTLEVGVCVCVQLIFNVSRVKLMKTANCGRLSARSLQYWHSPVCIK